MASNAEAASAVALKRRPRRHARRQRFLLVVSACGAAMALLAFFSLMLGAINFAPATVLTGLTSDSDSFVNDVIWKIRFPRLLDAMLVGAALAVAGVLLQVVTRNPLADPTILGVSSAAGLATAITLTVAPLSPQWALAAAAVGGGLIGAMIIFAIARQGVVSPIRLTLAGVAVSAFFSAAIVGILTSSRTFLQLSLGFLVGGLYGSEWRDFNAVIVYVMPALAVAYLLSNRLNALALGDDIAAGLGVLTDRTRLLVLAVVGVLAGAAVAVAGIVSFVGLVCPHLARFVVGSDNRYLIPASALTGAILVGAADLAARLVIRPAEIPMGIITAGIGAPFLLYLVRFRR